MTENEGVVQYRLDHHGGALPAQVPLEALFDWFRRCRELALIGRDPARYGGLAFGNLSIRAAQGFVISGTQTGGLVRLGPKNLAWVQAWDVKRNEVRSSGPARPSSEAMTHGQIYRARPDVGAVIHVHSPSIWTGASSLGLAITDAAAGYGTPAMAAEVDRLMRTALHLAAGVFAMGGHQDGVVAFAADMDGAGGVLLATLSRAQGAGTH